MGVNFQWCGMYGKIWSILSQNLISLSENVFVYPYKENVYPYKEA